MKRAHVLLLAVIVTELCLGGLLAQSNRSRPTTPRPDFTLLDSVTADELRQAADAGARTAEAWAALGEKYLVTGYYPEAEACYREAARLQPADSDRAFKHGFALERLGLAAEANARYADAIALGHPRAAELWFYIGRNRLRLNDDDAAEAFARAGDVPASRLEAGKLHARARQFEQADVILGKLAAEFPRSHGPTTMQYRVALDRGDRSQASRLADRFDRQRERLTNPFDTDYEWMESARDNLGYRKRKKSAIAGCAVKLPTEAERDLNAVQAIDWSPEVADHLAEAHFRNNRPAEAVRVIEEAIAKDGPSFQLVWRLGDAYAAAGRISDARREWERAERFGTGPDLKDLRLLLANTYDQSGERDRARLVRAGGLASAGTALLDAGRLPVAYEALAQATSLAPESADAWYWLGETCRAGGRFAEARAAYDRCRQLNPDHGRAERAVTFLPK